VEGGISKRRSGSTTQVVLCVVHTGVLSVSQVNYIWHISVNGQKNRKYALPFLTRCVLHLNQWFPTGEEFLPGEESHEFRGGISTLL